jgi:hypothetical protein
MYITAKRTLFSLPFFILVFMSGYTATPAHAQSQEYRGMACIISVNAHCPSYYQPGQCKLMRFRPPNALGNPDRTRLSLFDTTYSQNFQQDGSAIGSTYQDVRFSWVGSGGGRSDASRTKWRIPVVQPASFSLPQLHMIVDFTRYDDFGPGPDSSICNLRYRVVGMKYPDQVATPASPATGGGDTANSLGNGAVE